MLSPIRLANPPSDIISNITFSPSSSRLLASSWDSTLYVYQRSQNSEEPFSLQTKISLRAPILDCAFGEDESTAYTVGLDYDVRRVDLESGEQLVLSTHNMAGNKVGYWREGHVVVSTSWDGTMHVHTPGTGAWARIQLAAKPFALSLSNERAVVSMADRRASVYDLRALKMLAEEAGPLSGELVDGHKEAIQVEPWQIRESCLKFMTRAVACMPDGQGFATSSIEGRCGVEWFDPEKQGDTYVFKCHRQTQTDEDGTQIDVVYPVNAVAWNRQYGTFATGGADGVVSIWDAQLRRRVRHFPALQSSVAAMEFSPDSKWLAIAVTPFLEDGKDVGELDRSLISIEVRRLGKYEAQWKEKKT